MDIIRYEESRKEEWDKFIAICKNKHFMFFRDYMDYHDHIFKDHSLLVYEKKNLVAVIPANESNSILYTHQGLTFGGVLCSDGVGSEFILNLFTNLKSYCSELGFEKIIYKCIPYIYSSSPSEEDRYSLFINDAKLCRRDVSVAIKQTRSIPYQKRRIRSIKKAKKSNVKLVEVTDFSDYWDLLNSVLSKNHNTKPVHTLEEIHRLRDFFPNNIRCFVAKIEDEVVSGTTMYVTDHVAHCQYLASNEKGRAVGALDYLLDSLISDEFKGIDYFDFGISNEEQGRVLNLGLIAQKEGFGARAVCHDFYELSL
jgi:hypothetical protein